MVTFGPAGAWTRLLCLLLAGVVLVSIARPAQAQQPDCNLEQLNSRLDTWLNAIDRRESRCVQNPASCDPINPDIDPDALLAEVESEIADGVAVLEATACISPEDWLALSALLRHTRLERVHLLLHAQRWLDALVEIDIIASMPTDPADPLARTRLHAQEVAIQTALRSEASAPSPLLYSPAPARRTGVIIASAGTIPLAIGVGLLVSSSLRNDSAQFERSRTDAPPSVRTYNDLSQQARRHEQAGWALIGVGGAALVSGLTTALVQNRRTDRPSMGVAFWPEAAGQWRMHWGVRHDF